MKRARLIIVALVLLVGCALGIFFFVAPQIVEQRMNGIAESPPYRVSDAARSLHESLLVADLHADSLLWGRDLVERGTRGHVDIPRLAAGNVALQVFSVVTKSPRGLNIERNDDSTDDIVPLAIAQRWPPETWFSLLERALYQARRLDDMARRSDGRFVLLRTRKDLARFLQRRRTDPEIVAGVLALEGAHPLGGNLDNLDRLFAAGYRMISFAHFFDNDLAGSAHGVKKGGLTERGREALRRMEESRIIVDLAHASDAQIEDVLRHSTRPVVVSHAGVRGTCDNNRNLSDAQLGAIAAGGGLIGIGFWETAVCGHDVRAIAAAQAHAARVVGPQHVALGSDFDGAVTTPFDATGMAKLTEALLEAGFGEKDIAMLMGGNQIGFFLEMLPD